MISTVTPAGVVTNLAAVDVGWRVEDTVVDVAELTAASAGAASKNTL